MHALSRGSPLLRSFVTGLVPATQEFVDLAGSAGSNWNVTYAIKNIGGYCRNWNRSLLQEVQSIAYNHEQ